MWISMEKKMQQNPKMTRVGFEPTPADADEKPVHGQAFAWVTHLGPLGHLAACSEVPLYSYYYLTSIPPQIPTWTIPYTAIAFFHLWPPTSPNTLSTSFCSTFRRSLRWPSGLRAALALSSINSACDASNESSTMRSSDGVGFRVDSLSPGRMLV